MGGLLSIFSKSAYHSVCKPVAVDNLLRVTAVVAVGTIINRYGGRTDITGVVYQNIALNPFTGIVVVSCAPSTSAVIVSDIDGHFWLLNRDRLRSDAFGVYHGSVAEGMLRFVVLGI